MESDNSLQSDGTKNLINPKLMVSGQPGPGEGVGSRKLIRISPRSTPPPTYSESAPLKSPTYQLKSDVKINLTRIAQFYVMLSSRVSSIFKFQFSIILIITNTG